MTRKRKKKEIVSPNTPDGAAQRIVSILDKIGNSGHRNIEVFRDWMELIWTTLDAMGRQYERLMTAESTAESPFVLEKEDPELAKLNAELLTKYHNNQVYLDRFGEAMHILFNIPSRFGYYDAIGMVYMLFGNPNPKAGQYFTPWNVAKLMGAIVGGDAHAEVMRRIEEAATKAAEADPKVYAAFLAAGLTGLLLKPGEESEEIVEWDQFRSDFFWNKLLPSVARFFDPIKIMDPCVGSGVMLLAAASEYPQWAVKLGLVQFYGMDIDPDCVKMCRINMRLYGLNSQYLKHSFAQDTDNHLKWALEASDQELAAYGLNSEFYRLARDAHQNGDQKEAEQRVAMVNAERPNMIAPQMSLFDTMGGVPPREEITVEGPEPPSKKANGARRRLSQKPDNRPRRAQVEERAELEVA